MDGYERREQDDRVNLTCWRGKAEVRCERCERYYGGTTPLVSSSSSRYCEQRGKQGGEKDECVVRGATELTTTKTRAGTRCGYLFSYCVLYCECKMMDGSCSRYFCWQRHHIIKILSTAVRENCDYYCREIQQYPSASLLL